MCVTKEVTGGGASGLLIPHFGVVPAEAGADLLDFLEFPHILRELRMTVRLELLLIPVFEVFGVRLQQVFVLHDLSNDVIELFANFVHGSH